MSPGAAPSGVTASLARRVTGCHVRGQVPTRERLVNSDEADCTAQAVAIGPVRQRAAA
jgi:hypothetical protein